MPAENWFSRVKSERYHGICYETHAEITAANFEDIEVFYNRTRQHPTLGYPSPMEYLDGWKTEQKQKMRLHLHDFYLMADEISKEPQKLEIAR